jgi:DNA (cytosine-5)-methyltransferase 1
LKKRLKAIDLFAGCGGLTEGLRKAGFDVVLAIDSDRLAVETYRRNHPKTRAIRADITKVSPQTVMKRVGLRIGELDLLAGCPPCQGFSTMRTLNGSRDGDHKMNDLVWVFLKFAIALRPRTIMLENVPGLAKDSRFQIIRTRLRHLGYTVSYAVLNAADYGVPQSRRRLVMVASREFRAALAEPLKRQKTVRKALANLAEPGRGFDALHDYAERRAPNVQRIIAAIPKDGGSRSQLPPELVLPCHRRMDGFKDVYGRMRWDGPAPTITGGCINPSKGRFLHPEQDRAMTLREAAILQGFPRNYKFSLTSGRFPTAQMIGNAFPPAFAEHHARLLARQLR